MAIHRIHVASMAKNQKQELQIMIVLQPHEPLCDCQAAAVSDLYLFFTQAITASFRSVAVLPRALFCSHHVPEHGPEGERLSHCLP